MDNETTDGTVSSEDLGRFDDAQEEREPSSSTSGAAAEGRYDPAQGSPDATPHPVAESHPDEVTRDDEPVSTRPDVAE